MLVDLAEVEHERRARALPGDRHALRDADADLPEPAIEDHAAMGRAVHERPEDGRRGRGAARAPADVLADQVRATCANIAANARSVRIDPDRLAALDPGPLPEMDPERDFLEGDPADVATYVLTLDAINFGSGWFPTLRKRRGPDGHAVSGYFTVSWGLADRFRALGPWTNAELRAMHTEEIADVIGQARSHELMALFAQALRQLGAYLGDRTALDVVAEAGAVVLAAGAWSRRLARSAGLELPLEPRWGQLARLTPRRREPPLLRRKVVDGSYLASVASADPGLEITTVLETTWEGDVLVGSSRARRGFDSSVDPSVTEAMVRRAARLVPAVADLPVDEVWSGLRPWLPDNLPAIGPSARVHGLWVATGHEGAGIALGPVTGRVLAQAFCGEAPLVDLGPYDPDRFVPQ